MQPKKKKNTHKPRLVCGVSFFKILLLPGYFGCFTKFVISFLVPNKHLLPSQDLYW